MTETSDNKEYLCIACKKPIHLDATICAECGSYQSRLKNSMSYLAKVIGIVLVVLSLLSWLASNYPTVRKTLFWQDRLEIIALNPFDPVAVANLGDGDLFVSHIYLVKKGPPPWSAQRLVFQNHLKPGEFTKKEWPDKSKPGEIKFIRVIDMSDDEWRDAVVNANNSDPCYALLYFHVNDPTYEEMQAIAQLRTFEVTGIVAYYSKHAKGLQRSRIEVIGALGRKLTKNCSSSTT